MTNLNAHERAASTAAIAAACDTLQAEVGMLLHAALRTFTLRCGLTVQGIDISLHDVDDDDSAIVIRVECDLGGGVCAVFTASEPR